MLHHLDAELDFVADFHLPSPVASSQPLRLPDGRWELGISIQTSMVKGLAQIVTSLQDWATYTSFKAWLLVVEDWVSSYTHMMPNKFGTGDCLFCGLFENQPQHVFLVGDL